MRVHKGVESEFSVEWESVDGDTDPENLGEGKESELCSQI